jgi:hypothetical protein
MTRNQMAFWLLFAVTMGVYATILLWSLPIVAAAAGGQVPFDMRPGGYSFTDAREFLTALSAEGRDFYVGVQHRLDVAYPALIAATLFFAVAALVPERARPWRWWIAAPALAIAVFDYAENGAVAAMLAVGPAALTPDLVERASTWTVWKSNLTLVVMTAVLILLALRALAWFRRRG